MDLELVSSKLSGHLNNSPAFETDCELLERRQMLAGFVTATISGAGDLVITGDKQSTDINVEIDEDGTVNITGVDGTTIAPGGNLGIEKVERDIRITLRGGDDVVNLMGTGASVPVRTVRINSGSGADEVSVCHMSGIEQDLVIATVSGDDEVLVEYTGVGRKLTINGASGLDQLRVENTEVGNEIEEIRGNLKVSSNSGDDEIHLLMNAVYGSIDLRSGGGNDLIDVVDSEAMYGGSFDIRSGSGNDRVYMDTSGATSPDSENYGKVSLNTASGDDLVEISNMPEGQLIVSGGAGNDDVVISGSDTLGMDFKLGGGDDLVNFEAGNSVSDGPFRINGGGGTDEVNDLGLVTSPIEVEFISIETLSGATSM